MTIDLPVQKREKLGKSARGFRKKGLIPAELYGHNVENIHLAVPSLDFKRVYKEAGENTILSLDIGGEKRPALIYNVQRDPITEEYRHIDFYQVRMDEAIETEVPLVFVGEAPAVKAFGGILVKALQTLPIEALPADLPHQIEVNISSLAELDLTLYVKDIALPKGVVVTIGLETAVVSVVTPKEEVEEVPVSVEDIKVETELKKAERDTAKTTEEKKE